MANDIGWELYRTLLAVLEERSLSGAARMLGITQPTAGRHVATLEKALNVVLFTRSPNGLLPTEAAVALRPYLESMRTASATLQRTAMSDNAAIGGNVRVSASDVIGIEALPPLLTALRQAHAHLNIELVLTNRIQDLLHREVDIAVRMLRPVQESLVARRVGEVEIGMHASRSYLEGRAVPATLETLAEHTLIGFDLETPFLRAAAAPFPWLVDRRFDIRTDSDVAQLALIRAGAGIGFCQVAAACRGEPLVRLLEDAFSMKLEIWVAMHEHLRHVPGCRATFDALVAGLRHYLAQADATGS